MTIWIFAIEYLYVHEIIKIKTYVCTVGSTPNLKQSYNLKPFDDNPIRES